LEFINYNMYNYSVYDWLNIFLNNGILFENELKSMKLLGNILWFVFGGLLSGLAWVLAGLIWCVTIVGIPVGVQCFKFAQLSFWPFGYDVEFGTGAVSLLVNIIWVVFFGWEMALMNLAIGALWCITIVGIPFGLQFFKLARLSLLPMGSRIVKI